MWLSGRDRLKARRRRREPHIGPLLEKASFPVEARRVRVVSPCLRPGLYRHCTVLLPAAVARNDVNQIFDQDRGKTGEEENRPGYWAARQQHWDRAGNGDPGNECQGEP